MIAIRLFIKVFHKNSCSNFYDCHLCKTTTSAQVYLAQSSSASCRRMLED